MFYLTQQNEKEKEKKETKDNRKKPPDITVLVQSTWRCTVRHCKHISKEHRTTSLQII